MTDSHAGRWRPPYTIACSLSECIYPRSATVILDRPNEAADVSASSGGAVFQLLRLSGQSWFADYKLISPGSSALIVCV